MPQVTEGDGYYREMKKDGEENIWTRNVFAVSIPEDTNGYDHFYFFTTKAPTSYIR